MATQIAITSVTNLGLTKVRSAADRTQRAGDSTATIFLKKGRADLRRPERAIGNPNAFAASAGDPNRCEEEMVCASGSVWRTATIY